MGAFIAVAELDELDGLVASAAALFAEDGGVRDPHLDVDWPTRDGAAFYRALIEKPDTLALLAFTNPQRDTVIGHLTGSLGEPQAPRFGSRLATLQSLRVAPSHRRTGVAAALIAAFHDWALHHGADEEAVTAYATNEHALALYRKHGFQDFDVTLHRNAHPASPR